MPESATATGELALTSARCMNLALLGWVSVWSSSCAVSPSPRSTQDAHANGALRQRRRAPSEPDDEEELDVGEPELAEDEESDDGDNEKPQEQRKPRRRRAAAPKGERSTATQK